MGMVSALVSFLMLFMIDKLMFGSSLEGKAFLRSLMKPKLYKYLGVPV